MEPDRELLDRWAAGDDRAGAQLFERHHTAVVRFFRAKGILEVEDLVQETFLELTRGRERFRAESSFRAFLFGTARNILRGYFRRRRRKEGNIDFGTHTVVDLGASPSAVLADRAEKRLLLEGLRRLVVDDQIVIELYMWESMTAPELAEVLGLTVHAVRSRLFRAKQRLREHVQALAESPDVLQSTLTSLEAWAGEIRREVEAPAEG
jgi:RNA polymerase sigma-70 factor (ECF subfamily)